MLARAKWQIKTIEVLELVFEERVRQEARYGDVNNLLEDGTGPESNWLTPLSNVNAKTIQQEFRRSYERHEEVLGLPTWMHLVREEIAEAFELSGDDPEFVTEILQVAALCVSWAERKL